MTNDNAATKFLVHDLDLYYGKFQALKKINLDIKERKLPHLSALPAAANPPF